MKFSHPRPTPLPGGPPVKDPDNSSNLPVEPDDGGVPSQFVPEEEGTDWQPPV